MGKLITIDGLDGSGKQTQTALLAERLCAKGIPCRLLSFPVYDSPSCALVRLYLAGEFGKDPNRVNAYAASSFFALDRYLTYTGDWKADYDAGKVIVADRYTTANAIHQLAKLPAEERETFLSWLSDYEYGRLSLPRPDATVFLEVPVETSLALIDTRGEKTDIHENREHLRRAFEAAQYVSGRWGWECVPCMDAGKLLSRETIHEEIVARLSGLLPGILD